MRHSEPKERDRVVSSVPGWQLFAVAGISLAAMIAIYLLSVSELSDQVKTRGFLGILAGVLLVFAAFYFRNRPSRANTPDVEYDLASLDDAHEAFAGVLRPDDAFRLLASRIKAIVPYDTLTIFLPGHNGDLQAAHLDGEKAINAAHRELAERSFSNLEIEIADGRSAAIPLSHESEPFAVMHLSFETARQLDTQLLDAIGTRAAPLIKSSMAFEQSHKNALKDETTDLPNERAFYLVLENQIAETQRKRETRPLSVLAIDIKDFDDINRKFGHPAGDRVLKFAAKTLQDILRQMDFLSRSRSDEFLAVLPTVSQEIAEEVAGRISTAFLARRFEIVAGEWLELELNIGIAAFGDDGETPASLLAAARLRKDQPKSNIAPRVVWFPNELSQ